MPMDIPPHNIVTTVRNEYFNLINSYFNFQELILTLFEQITQSRGVTKKC